MLLLLNILPLQAFELFIRSRYLLYMTEIQKQLHMTEWLSENTRILKFSIFIPFKIKNTFSYIADFKPYFAICFHTKPRGNFSHQTCRLVFKSCAARETFSRVKIKLGTSEVPNTPGFPASTDR